MDAFSYKLIQSGQTTISNYLLSNFSKLNMTPNELIIFLQIKRLSDEGIKIPHVNMLTESTGLNRNQVYEILHQMIQKKLMTFNSAHDSNTDEYDFTLLYKKLDKLSHTNQDNNVDLQTKGSKPAKGRSETMSARELVFKTIEREFGRDLSPMEISTVSDWMDVQNYSPKMIKLALWQAVLSQVYNLRYIDKVLRSWYDHNITTPQALDTVKKKARSQYKRWNTPKGYKKGPHIPIFKL